MEILFGALAEAILGVVFGVLLEDASNRQLINRWRSHIQAPSKEQQALQRALWSAYGQFKTVYPGLAVSFFDEYFLKSNLVVNELAKLLTPTRQPDIMAIERAWQLQLPNTPHSIREPIQVFVADLKLAIGDQLELLPFTNGRAFQEMLLLFKQSTVTSEQILNMLEQIEQNTRVSLKRDLLVVDEVVSRDKNIAGDEVEGDKVSGNKAMGDIHYTIYNYSYPTSSTSSDRDNILRFPYKGLLPFRPDDAIFFFGREKVTKELVQLTNKHTAITVLGASGSGKSSVVLAGLVPVLQESGRWKFVHFRPGPDPFLSLAKALIPLYEPNLGMNWEQAKEARKIANALSSNELTIKDIFDGIQVANPQERLLLIADQFEELFTLCPNEKLQRQFLDSLIQCCQPLNLSHSPFVVVFTLRADFLAIALNNPSFAEVLRSDVKLGPMRRDELERVIAMPAQQLGVRFEEGLIERIVKEVENKPGNLPLLEFALSLLWKKQIDNQITHNAYEEIGQVEGALARYANDQYNALRAPEKELAQYIFTQLVHPGNGTEDTRQITIINELGENTWPVVKKLADLRLVVTNQNANGQKTVEIVHEALIRHWGKLDEWINQIRTFRMWQEQLRFELKRWSESGHDEGALLRGAFLDEAKHWLKERLHDLRQAEQNFIQVSIKQQEQDQQEKKEAARIRLALTIQVEGAANLDLLQADLVGANLTRANLTRANLQGSDLSGANLSRANLQGADLRNTDLREANLSGADLREVKLDHTTQIDNKWRLVWQIINQGADSLDLSQSDLRRAYLRGASLEKANLTEANLREVDLEKADLREADLEKADLREADLEKANLAGADLRKADLRGAYLVGIYLQRANLSGANLSGANLSGAYLREANWSGANLQGSDLRRADLRRADLREANLSGADLREAKLDHTTQIDNKWRLVWQIINQGALGHDLSRFNLVGAYLVGANLIGANLQRADLREANLQGANLQEADLRGADLRRADLREANLSGADLREAKLDHTTQIDNKWRLVWQIINQGAAGSDLSPFNLAGANLAGANLAGANLAGANLAGADLQRADLREANLQRADLREANLQRTDLREANLQDAYVLNTIYDSHTKWPRSFTPTRTMIKNQ